MQTYVLRLYRSDGSVSIVAEAILIDAASDDEAVVCALQVERPLIDGINLMALFSADSDLVWATAPDVYCAAI